MGTRTGALRPAPARVCRLAAPAGAVVATQSGRRGDAACRPNSRFPLICPEATAGAKRNRRNTRVSAVRTRRLTTPLRRGGRSDEIGRHCAERQGSFSVFARPARSGRGVPPDARSFPGGGMPADPGGAAVGIVGLLAITVRGRVRANRATDTHAALGPALQPSVAHVTDNDGMAALVQQGSGIRIRAQGIRLARLAIGSPTKAFRATTAGGSPGGVQAGCIQCSGARPSPIVSGRTGDERREHVLTRPYQLITQWVCYSRRNEAPIASCAFRSSERAPSDHVLTSGEWSNAGPLPTLRPFAAGMVLRTRSARAACSDQGGW